MKLVEIFAAAVGLILGGFVLAQGETALGGLLLGMAVLIILFEQPKHSPVRLRPFVRKLFLKAKQTPAPPETRKEPKVRENMIKLFTYKTLDGNLAEITKYLGSDQVITIPAEVDGYPVISVSSGAFSDLTISKLHIPDSVMRIHFHAFDNCTILNLDISYNCFVSAESFYNCYIAEATVAKNDEGLWTRVSPEALLHLVDAPLIQEKGFVYYLRSNGTLDLVEYTEPVSQLIIPAECQGHAVKRILYGPHNCSTLSIVWVSEGIEILSPNAFYNCKNLREVHLPRSIRNNMANIPHQTRKNIILSVDPQLEAGSGDGAILFEDPEGHADALDMLNTRLSQMELLKVSVGKINVYMETTATTVEKTGEKTVTYRAGLEKCSLWCSPVTTPGSGDHYQISLYAESDENALHERFHQEHPGHLIRAKTVIAFRNKPNGVFVLHSKAYPIAAAATPVQPQPAPAQRKTALSQEEITVYDGIQYAKKENGTLDVVGLHISRPHLQIPAVVHGQRVVTIRANAFAGNQILERVQISSGISGIEAGAFENCANLTQITIPASVTAIGKSAFLHCGELETTDWVDDSESSDPTTRRNAGYYGPVAYPRVKRENRLQITVTAGSYAQKYCRNHSILHMTVTDPDVQQKPKQKPVQKTISHTNTPKRQEDSVTQNGISFRLRHDGTASVLGYTGNASSVTIPRQIQDHTVTGIEAGAFQNCYPLTHVAIPGSVTSIAQNAFQNCGRKEVVDEDLAQAYTARSRRDLEFMFGYGYEYYESRIMSGEDPVKVTYDFSATVSRDSYAEKYCKSNNIRIAGYW